MKAFPNPEITKDKVMAILASHVAADKLIKGSYWEEGKGCGGCGGCGGCVGCAGCGGCGGCVG